MTEHEPTLDEQSRKVFGMGYAELMAEECTHCGHPRSEHRRLRRNMSCRTCDCQWFKAP